MKTLHTTLAAVAAVFVAASTFGQTQLPAPSGDLLKEAQQKIRDGDLEGAKPLLEKAVAASPDARQPHQQLGILLDLMGQYDAARKHLEMAIDHAESDEGRISARRAMAMSYGFTDDCANAAKYETPNYDYYLKAKDFYMAGEMANELARVCLEAGDLATAEKWYRAGYEAGPQEPDIKPDRKDLWDFRWEHAQARLAARRGNAAEAQKHVAAAKAILDKETNPDQAQFFPYLTGYVAFYTGDYKTALAELQKGNQRDPFILSLIAQTYEKLGQQDQAMEYYRKVLTINIHNPTGAFSRPLAKKKLGVS